MFNAIKVKTSLCAEICDLFSLSSISRPYDSGYKVSRLAYKHATSDKDGSSKIIQACHFHDLKPSGHHIYQQRECHPVKMSANTCDYLYSCFYS